MGGGGVHTFGKYGGRVRILFIFTKQDFLNILYFSENFQGNFSGGEYKGGAASTKVCPKF